MTQIPSVCRFILAATLVLLPACLFAEDPNFAVTIVGYEEMQPRGQAKACPFISLPAKPVDSDDNEPDKATGQHYYVLIRNIAKTPIRLNLATSEWYDALEFLITAPDGKTFHIKRPLTEWEANADEAWLFQPDEERIFTVNFTSGRWTNLPPQSEVPSLHLFKIKATFHYNDPVAKKEWSFSSAQIDAMNGT